MVFLCKRCGRVLKSEKSINLGYGPTCYRIRTFHNNPINIEEEIKFLKLEITTLKNFMRELKANKITSSQTSPIINLKEDERTPDRDANKDRLIEVIQELKSCFQNCNGDVKRLLKPIQIETNLMETSQLAFV